MRKLESKEHELFLQLLKRYPQLQKIQESILDAYFVLKNTYLNHNKILIGGNGGSAADAEHIVGELMKGFKQKRNVVKTFKEELVKNDGRRGLILANNLQEALPAIAIHNHISLHTAYSNDVDGQLGFAQQVYGYGQVGDTFLAISTSGNSENILYAVITARVRNMKTIGLTGNDGGKLGTLVDILVAIPEEETYMVQELCTPIYHCWCLMLEEFFFGTDIISG